TATPAFPATTHPARLIPARNSCLSPATVALVVEAPVLEEMGERVEAAGREVPREVEAGRRAMRVREAVIARPAGIGRRRRMVALGAMERGAEVAGVRLRARCWEELSCAAR